MQNLNRDLLVITKRNVLNKTELEQTIIGLNNVLFKAESWDEICNATEIFDLNLYKKIMKPNKVAYYLNKANAKPFVFLFNKN